jgi:hypothetical protein
MVVRPRLAMLSCGGASMAQPKKELDGFGILNYNP